MALREAIFLFFLFGAALAVSQTYSDSTDALRFSCETFPRGFTEDDLRARFGAENVVRDQITLFDDRPQEATVVFRDDPARRLFVTWTDLADGTGPGGVRISDLNSAWQNVDGLSTGDSLRAVEAANGWPFRLNPLTFEGGGRVRDWGQGRLTDLDSGLPECLMTIGFGIQSNVPLDPLLVRQVSSPRIRELSSGHPALQELNPVIVVMSISFPNVR